MRVPAFLVGWLMLAGMAVTAATNTATVRMFCLSLRVEPGTARQFGLEYTLSFSSAHFAPPNHEFFPIFGDDLTHDTLFQLEGPEYPEPLPGELALSLPETIDGNTNGVPDIYEVAADFAADADGFWISDVDTGEVTSTWQRSAGEHRGTVRLTLTSSQFGALPEFTHAFEVIEYGGTFIYQPGGTVIQGAVSLQRVGATQLRLSGPLEFAREPTNRLAQFAILESVLTNDVGQLVPVSVGEVERDPDYTMDYFGAVALLNGDPATPEVDYELFFIGLDDPHDTDGDGIPDLTDDADAPPAPPRLAVTPDGDQLRFTITGETGQSFTLQRAAELDPRADAWLDERAVTLDAPTMTLSLPRPAAQVRFWRLRWP